MSNHQIKYNSFNQVQQQNRGMRSNGPTLLQIYNNFVQSPSTLFILQASPFAGLTCQVFDWNCGTNDHDGSYSLKEETSGNTRKKAGLFSKVLHQLKQNQRSNHACVQDKPSKSNAIPNKSPKQSKYQFYFERDADGNLLEPVRSNASSNDKNTHLKTKEQIPELPFQQIRSQTKSKLQDGGQHLSIDVDFSFEEICANRQKNIEKKSEHQSQNTEKQLQCGSISKQPQIIRIQERPQHPAGPIQANAHSNKIMQTKQSLPKIVINYCNRETPNAKLPEIPVIVGSRPAQSHVIERVIQVEGSRQKIVDKSIKIDFDFDTNFI